MENETHKLYGQIRELILSARKAVSHSVDSIQVLTNFETGRLIVEHEQKGVERAEYGKKTLKELSKRLGDEFGRGYSLTNLKLMRQFNSGLYERLVLSRDKEGVRELAQEGQSVSKPKDLLKDPYVLEFLGLDEKAKYSESDLEAAIIDKLEHFLLELGKGFLFEARQKRITFDEDHFFIDLVFYNRLLRCYVLIDLKIGKLTHQNLGQMQMYVNYFDRYVKLNDEHPTVGIILCKKKHDALVEITLPEDTNIHASEYQLYLPSKEELKQKLMDWTAETEVDDGK